MNADTSPTVQSINHRLNYLVKQGQSLIDENIYDDGSMLGPEILSQLELLASKDEKITASHHPVIEASARDILYPLLVCIYVNRCMSSSFNRVRDQQISTSHLFVKYGSYSILFIYWATMVN